MHLLIVEDEDRIRDFLVKGLQAEGHTALGVETVSDARDAIHADSSNLIDLVILDRMLDQNDGADLIPFIKNKNPSTLIVILSAIGSAEEKAELLDKGADEYLSKPFSLVELSARIRALTRRRRDQPRKQLTVKDCEVDLVEHSVKINGEKMELSQKEYQLLLVFLKHPGRVYNRFQLLDQVWNAQYEVESNVVEVTINNIRRKLEAKKSAVLISSKRNVGYWVEA